MPHDIRIPRLGWSMEEGTFVRWLKRAGESVKPGEPLYELEGEKSVEAIEAIDGGILHVPAEGPAEGTVVKVGALVGWLLDAGEAPPAFPAAPSPAPSPPPAAVPATARAPATPAPRPAASPPPAAPLRTTRQPRPAVAPRRRSGASREIGVDLATVTGSGPAGRIMADDVFAVARARVALPGRPVAGGRVPSSPRARATAARLGVDWRSLAGSGRGGRVREADVVAAAEGARVTQAPRGPTSRLAGLPKRRRTIAERMLASREETAPVTLHCRADASALVALRKRLRAKGADPVPAFTDLLAKAVASLLVRHPHLAGCWDRDGALVFPAADGLHVGIAVDTAAGLLVPVVRDVGRRSLAEVAAAARHLIDRARSGSLAAADMEGGVFTITNLGGFGIDEFTPIINLPQAAILGVGSIRREPVVVTDTDGAERIAVRERMALSLTFDHCRVDGAPAARFLDDLRAAIEAPDAIVG